MYFLIKWLIGRLKRRAAAAAQEPGTVDRPDQPMVRAAGDRLVSQDRTVAPSAGHDGAALTVRNLSKRFGNRIAFQDVSFEVGHGEVFGFLGPNGAGKPVLWLWHFFAQRPWWPCWLAACLPSVAPGLIASR